MSIKNKINSYAKRKEQEILTKGVEAVKDKYDEVDTRQEAIQEAAKRVIRELEAHPDMPAIAFLKMLQDEKKLPDDVVVEASTQISEVKSEEILVELMEELDIPSKDIQYIIKKSDISVDTAKKVAEQIPDETIQEEEKRRLENIEKEKKEEEEKREQDKIKRKLREKYVKCDEIPVSTLVSNFSDIEANNRTSEVNDMIKQILARKAAIDWKHSGSARIQSMMGIISPEEMLEENFSQLVEEEFRDVEKIEKYPGEKKYQQEDMQKIILSQIAKNVVKMYREVGVLDVPQSDNMKNLTPEQEEFFVNQVQIYGKEINIKKVRQQIRGIMDYELEDFIKMIEKIPESERGEYIKKFKEQIQMGIQERGNTQADEDDERTH